MDFPEVYVQWINSCITSPYYSVAVNGSLAGYSHGGRGVRQAFNKLSAHRFNPEKIELFSGGLATASIANFLSLIGFEEGCIPMRYLGLPLVSDGPHGRVQTGMRKLRGDHLENSVANVVSSSFQNGVRGATTKIHVDDLASCCGHRRGCRSFIEAIDEASRGEESELWNVEGRVHVAVTESASHEAVKGLSFMEDCILCIQTHPSRPSHSHRFPIASPTNTMMISLARNQSIRSKLTSSLSASAPLLFQPPQTRKNRQKKSAEKGNASNCIELELDGGGKSMKTKPVPVPSPFVSSSHRWRQVIVSGRNRCLIILFSGVSSLFSLISTAFLTYL
ncbi:hypothetical protein CRG98_011740 [Punica granatum]|uniref:Uncharacterized protein n=1 Tax=Punica granatum TaxID=22663 RepID=A0A2I0KH95_PUNGR|nr:hypothetical protein CRG98_011740 [Punica granatum]